MIFVIYLYQGDNMRNKNEMMLMFLILVIVAVLVVAIFTPKNEDKPVNLTAYFFDVGDADSALLTTDNHNVLIDTGMSSSVGNVLNYLIENEIKDIDYLIITHPDQDHIGGAEQIINYVNVKNVIQGEYKKGSSEEEAFEKALAENGIVPTILTEDSKFELDDIEFDINVPKGNYKEDDSNNSSLIVSVINRNNKLLFMGDARKERVKEFLESGKIGKYDFVKVPHHGECGEEIKDLLKEIRPSYSVISTSSDKYTDNDTKRAMKGYKVDAFFTGKHPVCLTSNGHVLKVEYKKGEI